MIGWPPCRPTSLRSIQELEVLHESFDLYLWLRLECFGKVDTLIFRMFLLLLIMKLYYLVLRMADFVSILKGKPYSFSASATRKRSKSSPMQFFNIDLVRLRHSTVDKVKIKLTSCRGK